MSNPVSTANIFGHPIHPMLIPFPLAFFVATFVGDIEFWQTGNPLWATAATWLLGADLVVAVLAAAAGLTSDFLGDGRIRKTAPPSSMRSAMSSRSSSLSSTSIGTIRMFHRT